jgi:uncharacterized protein (TIGR01244 family)
MAEVRQVTDAFAVAAQLEAADMAALKAAGFRRVIGNRPDEEAPPGSKAADIRKAAEAAGLLCSRPVRGAAHARGHRSCGKSIRSNDRLLPFRHALGDGLGHVTG